MSFIMFFYYFYNCLFTKKVSHLFIYKIKDKGNFPFKTNKTKIYIYYNANLFN